MAYTSHITIDGMLIGEITPAGGTRNYGTDHVRHAVQLKSGPHGLLGLPPKVRIRP